MKTNISKQIGIVPQCTLLPRDQCMVLGNHPPGSFQLLKAAIPELSFLGKEALIWSLVFGAKQSHLCGVSSSPEVRLRFGNSLTWREQGHISDSHSTSCPGCEHLRSCLRVTGFTPFPSLWLHQTQEVKEKALKAHKEKWLWWSLSCWALINCGTICDSCTASLWEQMSVKHREALHWGILTH